MSDQQNAESVAGELFRMVAAAMVGALIGAGVALALAPKAGTDFRAEVKARAGTAAEKAQEIVGSKARELVAEAKRRIEEARAGAACGEPPAAEAAATAEETTPA